MTRDIAELDTLAHEIKVCLDKSDNYSDTARQKFKTVEAALDRGEYGDDGRPWTAKLWLNLKVTGDDEQQIMLLAGRPYERAEAAIKAEPHLSDRAIALKIGVSHQTVSNARLTVKNLTVEKRVGLDGKERRMPSVQAVREPRFDSEQRQLDALLAMWSTSGTSVQQRFLDRIGARLVKQKAAA